MYVLLTYLVSIGLRHLSRAFFNSTTLA